MSPSLACPVSILLWLAPVAGDDPLAGIDGPATLVVTGYPFTEGPLWDERRGGLLFSQLDTPSNRCDGGATYLLTLPADVRAVRDPSCNANGLAFDPGGALLAAEHGSRSVTRSPADGAPRPLAERFDGKPFNAPNDVVVRSDGTVYFTDPSFIRVAAPRLGFDGLYRIEPDGETVVLEARLHSPNGVALSPDERTLYVSNMRRNEVVAFAVGPKGELDDERVFATGAPMADGLTVDANGNLFVATRVVRKDREEAAGAVLAFAPNGRRWGSIEVGETARNCAFGGEDRRTLFIAAGASIYSIRLTVPGVDPARADTSSAADTPPAER